MRNLILHNPRCSKSRETLKLLQERGIELEIVEYLGQPPSKDELREICRLLGKKPLQIMRTQEELFSELGLSTDNGYSDEQWLDVLARHSKLLERPIVVHKGRAVIGRPPQNVLGIL
jgi:arsenate reductase